MILLRSYARVSMFFNFKNNNCEIKQNIKNFIISFCIYWNEYLLI